MTDPFESFGPNHGNEDRLQIGLISPVFPHPRGGVYVGIERQVVELARHLRAIGCLPTVFTTFWNGGDDGDYFEGIQIRRVRDLSTLIGRPAAVFDLHYITWGRNLLKFEGEFRQCDVLHALAPLSTAEVLTSKGFPLVTHFHHFEAITAPRELLYKPFHRRLEGRAYHGSNLVVTPSRHSAGTLQRFFRLPEGKIRVVPQGVDMSRFTRRSGGPSDPPTILIVGAHERRKGLVYLWRALGLLLKQGMDFRVLTVGTGQETERLKSLAGKLGLASRIQFLGYLSDPSGEKLPLIYRQADLLVHPSLEEGFGMVLAEAMASGVPVVASLAGAIPEVVGDAGILVPPRSVEALALAIRKILTDRRLYASAADRGRARAEESFSWERIARKTVEVYEEAIEIARRPS